MSEDQDNGGLSERVTGLRRDLDKHEKRQDDWNEAFTERYNEDRRQKKADDRWWRRIWAAAIITGAIGLAYTVFQNGLVNLATTTGG